VADRRLLIVVLAACGGAPAPKAPTNVAPPPRVLPDAQCDGQLVRPRADVAACLTDGTLTTITGGRVVTTEKVAGPPEMFTPDDFQSSARVKVVELGPAEPGVRVDTEESYSYPEGGGSHSAFTLLYRIAADGTATRVFVLETSATDTGDGNSHDEATFTPRASTTHGLYDLDVFRSDASEVWTFDGTAYVLVGAGS
jgi:hypothetical protein